MKLALVFTLFIAVAVLSVSGTSPPNCATFTCDPATCEVVNCNCGTYKDSCGCCDFCHKCPGEECSSLFRDPCAEGYHCVLTNPEEGFVTGGRGHCVSLNETSPEPHHHGHTEHKH
ncbi:8.6 kDa transglutaminase substrate [Rhipicephalus sanguineus]|uniref:8.6 kDa transglutaminase substrate n=1 Tax=Rhipicephalus sanguineus TaxID=34632 RepID=UPI001894563E|nr:8.6 kDa transglutaminase substrate [Rhipicephalus sanguineus]